MFQLADGFVREAFCDISGSIIKYAVASVIGFIKGKSAIAIARMQGKERNFAGEHFWARGYAVSTVGFNEEEVRRYIRNQNGSDESGRFGYLLTASRRSDVKD